MKKNKFVGRVNHTHKTLDFVSKNADLPISSPGVIIEIFDYHGQLEIKLGVYDDTTSDNIHKAVSLLMDWKERLLAYQGPLPLAGMPAFLEWLSDLQEWNMSWEQIRMTYNDETGESLTRRQVIDKVRTWRKGKIHKAHRGEG